MLDVSPVLLASVITCPDDARLVIRDMEISELTGTAGTILVLHGPSSAPIAVWERTADTPLGHFQWQGRVILNPGESTFWTIVSGTWAAIICGYELSLP